MARAFGHPQGVGLLGPGTDSLLRTLLVDALADRARPRATEVILTRAELERLFPEDIDQFPAEHYDSELHVTATLEDAIERLEDRAASWNTHEAATRPPILWLAAPGEDADVVHDTLCSLDGADIIAIFRGAWPYGPTHLVDADGPRQVPNQLELLSASEAIGKLTASP
ncbi:response regulator receiver/SARP domain-containing protein [Actinomadura verrucosospora]|uniref:Response regulator receiver/SARP domain-containing protein n=2 Tax=Actinomadura verrucosospora TaxID=46165 RepID=A0A7D3VW27_ACTVE|nr:response regulator receiver/SARP domain-containing protein [Actinomadura verrucosospora]